MAVVTVGKLGCATTGFLRMGLDTCLVMSGGCWDWVSSMGRGGRAGGASVSCAVLAGGSSCDVFGEEMRRSLEESTWPSGEAGVDGVVVWVAVSAT